MHITFVKKIKSDGEACRKCADVEQRLRDGGYWNCIDAVIVADERQVGSAGAQLAASLGVDKAPFFVVENDTGGTQVYTVYFKLLREVLEQMPHQAPAYDIACA